MLRDVSILITRAATTYLCHHPFAGKASKPAQASIAPLAFEGRSAVGVMPLGCTVLAICTLHFMIVFDRVDSDPYLFILCQPSDVFASQVSLRTLTAMVNL